MSITFSPAAIADLQSISNYTSRRWGPEQEEKYVGGLWELLERTAEKPGDSRMRPELGSGCHCVRYQRHVVFFVLSADRIAVIRILHGAMDFRSHLFEEDFPGAQ